MAPPTPPLRTAASALRAAGPRLLGYGDTDYGPCDHDRIIDDVRRCT
ncbi:hypothetical protein ACWD4G_15475 [Streptomyces sp. NPDC002643]